MAMNASEMEGFFGEQVELFLAGAEKAGAEGKLYVAASGFETAFHSKLMQGLIRWRSEGRVPSGLMSEALEIAARAVAVLEGAGEGEDGVAIWKLFDVGPALFLEILLRVSMGLGRAACPREAWEENVSGRSAQVLDVVVARSIREHGVDEAATAIFRNLEAKKRWRLLAATYSNYATVIECINGDDGDGVLRAARTAGELFAKRERDAFYSGGRQTEGGGPDNSFVVDYRLASILGRGPWVQVLESEGFHHIAR